MSKPTLLQIQRGFRDAVQTFDLKPHSSKLFLNSVVEQGPLSTQERISIYSEAWWIRLSNSLMEDYPVVLKVLGEDCFDDLIRLYFKEYPSRSYTLAKVGDYFPDFIEKWCSARSLEWLSDLAHFERGYNRAYLAKDAIHWSLASLHSISPRDFEKVVLKTESSTFLMRSNWGIHEVWNQEKQIPMRHLHFYLLYRTGFQVFWKSIEQTQYEVLSKIEKKVSLGEVLDFYPDEKLVHWLSEWAQENVIRPEVQSVQSDLGF
jgi:hypothetical protein